MTIFAAITWSDLRAFWPHLVGFVTVVVDLLASGHAILHKRDTRFERERRLKLRYGRDSVEQQSGAHHVQMRFGQVQERGAVGSTGTGRGQRLGGVIALARVGAQGLEPRTSRM